MPQPEILTGSLGDLQITATEKGYKIVDLTTQEVRASVQEPFAICTATNMQRAMMRAHQIMEDEEDAADAKAATAALTSGEKVYEWEETKKSLGI